MKPFYFFFGYILYLNYRIIYAFFLHKRVNNFRDFSKSKEDDNTIPVILTVDVSVLSLWLFGIWWTIGIISAISILNLIVFLAKKALKKID